QWRYALWLLVVVRLLVPVTPPSAWSLFNYSAVERFSTPDIDWWMRSEIGESFPQSSRESALESSPSNQTGETVSRPSTAAKPESKPIPAAGFQIQSALIFLRQNVGWIWFLGVLALSMRLAWGNYLFALQLKRRRPIANPQVLALFRECRQTMGLRRPLTLLEAPELDGPALFGCFRSKLLLPEKMIEAFTLSELRHVFLHELAHIRRWDAAVNWLTTILQTLHWFNPVLWFAFHRMRADRELACDELALARANEAESKPYGQTLIKVLEGFTGPTAIPGLVGILEDKTQIKRRIHMIAQFKKTSPWPVLAAVLLLSLGLVSLTDAQTKKGAEKLAEESLNGNAARSSSVRSKLRSKVAATESTAGLKMRTLLVPKQFLEGFPSPSPDGRFMTVGSWGSGTEMLELSTGRVRADTNLVLRTPRFSPDGKQLASSYYDDRGIGMSMMNRVVVLDLATQKTRELYRNEESNYLDVTDWSADGQMVLFIFKKKDQSRSWNIATVSVNNRSAHVVKTLERWNSLGGLKFSSDGRWIVYDAPNGPNDNSPGDVYVLAADGSQEIPLVQHPADDCVLGWAPYGDRVLFASNRRRTWDLFSIQVIDGKPVGEPELVKEAIGRGRPLGFTRAGAFFYRVETSSKDVYLSALDPVSGKIQGAPTKVPFTFEGHTATPDWSQDGRFLACSLTPQGSGSSSASGTICIRNMVDGTERELKLDGGSVWFPRWSPDGTCFVASGVEKQRHAFFHVDAQTGKAVWIPIRPQGGTLAGWNPDGRAFYYPTGGAIVRRDVRTGDETRFPVATNSLGIGYTYGNPPILAPNAQMIAFRWVSLTNPWTATLPQSLYVSSLSGGELRRLATTTPPEFIDQYEVFWTPDSRYVMFTTARWQGNVRQLSTLWRVSATGGEAEKLGEMPEGASDLRISPDGRQLAFTVSKSKRDIWVMENFLPKDDMAAK
ncbi:MAG: PD40 domain-containing protein, partial [Verrucomicrobia bacterium]|nr:PD40 domain-containing protein [Verrucomicrobiota bacterium]